MRNLVFNTAASLIKAVLHIKNESFNKESRGHNDVEYYNVHIKHVPAFSFNI